MDFNWANFLVELFGLGVAFLMLWIKINQNAKHDKNKRQKIKDKLQDVTITNNSFYENVIPSFNSLSDSIHSFNETFKNSYVRHVKDNSITTIIAVYDDVVDVIHTTSNVIGFESFINCRSVTRYVNQNADYSKYAIHGAKIRAYTSYEPLKSYQIPLDALHFVNANLSAM
jgi:hypothetical protein